MKRHSFDFEVKELDESGEFVGYLAVTGNKDEYDDVIEPGAFKKTNRENTSFPLLWQHQPDEPIGVLKEFEEDERGEKVIGDINLETQKGKEAYSLLKQGAIKGLSIGYESVKDVIEEGIRRIKEIKLFEGSVVTFPANPLAMVQAVKGDKDGLSLSLLQMIGVGKHYKSDELTDRHERLIDETIDSLKSLRPTEPDNSTRDGNGADTSDQEPSDTLGDLVADMKNYVNQQR